MSNEQPLLPKFLTEEIVRNSITTAVDMVFRTMSVSRRMVHVVVLVPVMKDARATKHPDWPDYPTRPYAIEKSFGDQSQWPYKFDDIARCKALQLWTDRNDGGTEIKPHLLFPGDTPFWGGVKRNGIVVSCSGVQPWFDRMIAGITADICVARAYDAWMNSADKADDKLCFLT